MEKSETIGKLAEALSKAQGVMGGAISGRAFRGGRDDCA